MTDTASRNDEFLLMIIMTTQSVGIVSPCNLTADMTREPSDPIHSLLILDTLVTTSTGLIRQLEGML